MRGNSLLVAMLVISSGVGVAPVWSYTTAVPRKPTPISNLPPPPPPEVSPAPAPPEVREIQVKVSGEVNINNNAAKDVKNTTNGSGNLWVSTLDAIKEMSKAMKEGGIVGVAKVVLEKVLAEACQRESPTSPTSEGLQKCLESSRSAITEVTELIKVNLDQASEVVQGAWQRVANNSLPASVNRSDSHYSYPRNRSANNPTSNPTSGSNPNPAIPSTSISTSSISTSIREAQNGLTPAIPSSGEAETSVGSRGIGTGKVEVDVSQYQALLVRNEEAHRIAAQMVYQILSNEGQALSDKQLKAVREIVESGKGIQELARGYEKATENLVLTGVRAIDSLGQQVQEEEGKLNSKTGEIQAKQSTQEVLKSMSELMKDIGLSTQKAIIATGKGVASSLTGLAKVAGSVEATVASVNNTNNILATIQENQIKSLELAATAINLQRQQMKMQEVELLEKYQNSLSSGSGMKYGIIGVPLGNNPTPTPTPISNPATAKLNGGDSNTNK